MFRTTARCLTRRTAERFARALSLALVAVFAAACNLARTADIPPTLDPARVPTLPPQATIGVLPGAPTLPAANDPLASGCPAPPPGWVAYTVQNGDSLGALAVAVGIGISELATTNCLENPDALFSGQTIYLPILPPGFAPNPTPLPGLGGLPGG
jgi:hypothetical protein